MAGLAKQMSKAGLFCLVIGSTVVVAQTSQSQPSLPSQAQIDALKSAVSKMPTPAQSEEFGRIQQHFTDQSALLGQESEKLSAQINNACGSSPTTCPVTNAQVQAAVNMHKKTRALYFSNLDAMADWGRRYNRMSCVWEADQIKAYTDLLSRRWLAAVAALSLTTPEDRVVANAVVGISGGGEASLIPANDPKQFAHSAGNQMVGLINVCNGADEFTPGSQ